MAQKLKRKSSNYERFFLISILFTAVMIGCHNQYSKYGSKNPVSLRDLDKPVYEGEGQNFIIHFINNPYNIDNRTVIVRLDTIIIYRGMFTMLPQNVTIPFSLINGSCNPNVMIVEPSLKEVYYFENKDGLNLPSSDRSLNIEFTKSKNFYDHIIFKTRK
jgi:hypothetical protein